MHLNSKGPFLEKFSRCGKHMHVCEFPVDFQSLFHRSDMQDVTFSNA